MRERETRRERVKQNDRKNGYNCMMKRKRKRTRRKKEKRRAKGKRERERKMS